MRTLENIQAYTAELVNVGMEDVGKEADLGRSHGVVVGEEELKLEDSAYRPDQYISTCSRSLGRVCAPSYGDWEGPWISTSK